MKRRVRDLARRYAVYLVNAMLKPVGVGLYRISSLHHYQAGLNRELYEIYRRLIFPDLVCRENHVELLMQLMGTNFSEAMWIIHLLQKNIHLEGDICEFGVASGATSAVMANEIAHTGKNIWLFDTFKGLPAPTEKDVLIDDFQSLGSMQAYIGAMSYPDRYVKNRLQKITFPPTRVKIVPGLVEETTKLSYMPKKICFAYVDLDFYQPTRLVLDFMADRIVPGGCALVDDYGYFSSGAQTAVDEFLEVHRDTFSMTKKSEDWEGLFIVLTRSAESDTAIP